LKEKVWTYNFIVILWNVQHIAYHLEHQ
jgi:hypothetical protein